METVTYELAHVGINLENQGDAIAAAETIASLFSMETRDRGKSIFVGEMFESLKVPFRGTKGHIALFASDLSAALIDLESRGAKFSYDDTIQYNEDGSLKNIYLHDEIAGFAIHIMQKPQ